MNTTTVTNRLFATKPNAGLAICRIALATSMTYHGLEKLLPPPHGTETGVMAGLHYFADFVVSLGMPAWLAYVSVFTEFLGGLLLMVGLFTRPVAALIVVNMMVALITVNARHGLSSSEYTLSLIAIALALMVSGGGSWSLDRLLGGARERPMRITADGAVIA